MSNRIKHLDGLRGLSILLVFFFHSFSAYPNKLYFLKPYSNIFIYKYGFLGVKLFFLISGFVILLSLENSLCMKSFLKKRWLRLFPAMFFCSIIIYATSIFLTQRPLGQPGLKCALPGLLFIEPNWLTPIVGSPACFLEGSFWSLYVEVKFYLISGLIFFYGGRKHIPSLIFLMYFISVIFQFFANSLNESLLNRISTLLLYDFSFLYFGWFATGMYLYQAVKDGNKQAFMKFTASGIFIVIIEAQGDFKYIGITISLLAIFAFVFLSKKLSSFFSNPLLIFFGMVSYPLYLLHENATISLIYQIHESIPYIPKAFIPVIPLFIISLISYIVIKFLEPHCYNFIRKRLKV